MSESLISGAVPTARPLAEYHGDYGFVTWWVFPICEPAWIGSPNCSDWPGYHTHWTPHPTCPADPVVEEGTR